MAYQFSANSDFFPVSFFPVQGDMEVMKKKSKMTLPPRQKNAKPTQLVTLSLHNTQANTQEDEESEDNISITYSPTSERHVLPAPIMEFQDGDFLDFLCK